jgi:DNA-binding transcriptional ArsR family regulator
MVTQGRGEVSLFIEFFGGSSLIKILDVLLESKPYSLSKAEISKKASISKAALFQHWKVLEKFKLVEETKKYGKIALFRLNEENVLVQNLRKFELALIKKDMGLSDADSETVASAN